MPIVEIFMRRGRTPAEIQAITDTVHNALVEAYEVPSDDRFQIVHQLEPHEFVFDAHFMGGPRSEKFLLVRVTGGRDRSVMTKRKLFSLIADNVERHGAVARSDVFVIVDNVQPTDFSVSNGHPFDQASLGLPECEESTPSAPQRGCRSRLHMCSKSRAIPHNPCLTRTGTAVSPEMGRSTGFDMAAARKTLRRTTFRFTGRF